MPRPRLLITGATGFLGAAFLAAYGRQFSCVALGRRRPEVSGCGRIDWIDHDLCEPFHRARLPRRADYVLHLASARLPSPGSGVDELYAVNTSATAALAAWAAGAGVRQFVLGSTGGIYGYRPGRIRETHRARPFDDYTMSKWQGELAALFHAPGRVSIVRYFFPYGPGQASGFVPRLVAAVASGTPVTLHARGRHPRLNPVFVDDAIDLTRRALVAGRGAIVNCAGPEAVRVPALAEAIGRLVGSAPTFADGTNPAVGDMVADMSRARQLLRFRPGTGIEAGLARTLAG
ncbi:MAG: NAD-dependent epimerase/dehydratase family protein [Vicinamibacterales bacterium]